MSLPVNAGPATSHIEPGYSDKPPKPPDKHYIDDDRDDADEGFGVEDQHAHHVPAKHTVHHQASARGKSGSAVHTEQYNASDSGHGPAVLKLAVPAVAAHASDPSDSDPDHSGHDVKHQADGDDQLAAGTWVVTAKDHSVTGCATTDHALAGHTVNHSMIHRADQVQLMWERFCARQLLLHLTEKSLAGIQVTLFVEGITSKCLNNTSRAHLLELKVATMLASMCLAKLWLMYMPVVLKLYWGGVCLQCLKLTFVGFNNRL
jgi:hypothetical protein